MKVNQKTEFLMEKESINIKMVIYLMENMKKEKKNLEILNIQRENMKDFLKMIYLMEKEFL